MRIPSREVPQANNLKDVIRVAETIAAGAVTHQEIANAISKTDRQGRYYRRAAEILGWVRNERPNHAVLTVTGWNVVNSSGPARTAIVKRSVLKADVFKALSGLLQKPGRELSRLEVQSVLERVTSPVGPSMMPRRVSTIVDWLVTIAVLKRGKMNFIVLEDPGPNK